MIVYFLRHGLAANRTDWAADDRLRPLTEQGRLRMEQIAKTIASLGLGLDLIITSPLTRAMETARIVAKSLHLLNMLVDDERLAPGFDVNALLEVLKSHPDVETVMLVGHEPDFSGTVSELSGGARVLFKKGGLARVDMADRSDPSGELVWLVPPKLLTR